MKPQKLTRRKVALDLRYSPYEYTVHYPEYRIKYIFSSELYRDKFKERIRENRETINNSLINRFGFDIEVNPLCDIKLYSSIEKRGFLILKEGSSEEWQTINDIEKLRFFGTGIALKQPTSEN